MGKRRTTGGWSGRSFPLFALILAFSVYGCGGGAEVGSEAGAGEDGGSIRGATQGRDGEVGEKVAVPGGSYTRVSPEELGGALRGGDLLLVNTHVPFAGDIPGTDLSVPYDRIREDLERLPADRDARIAVYCLGGPMSASASKALVGLGYENVWDLRGGMEAWEAAGYPLGGT